MSMFDVMSQAKNAIDAYNQALQVNSANIAGMNVPGFKRIDASFQTIFERVLSQGTAASNNMGGTNPRQEGSGISLSSVAVDFSNGQTTTGAPLDLAISGSGLFVVSPDGGNTYLYSRVGNFQINSAGNLTSNGMQVYGFNSSGAVTPITGLPSGNKSNYQWQPDGTLEYTSDGGTTYTSTGYKIALTYFANPGGLAQAQGSSFRETIASGSPATFGNPGGVYGTVSGGFIEQSNVVYLTETINSLELQKALNGNLTVIKMASDLITSFIQKLG
ncbi:MAG: flagellar hook-basal body complex protein [bacterium]